MRYINLQFTYLYRVNGYKKKVMCRPVKERQETDRQAERQTDRQADGSGARMVAGQCEHAERRHGSLVTVSLHCACADAEN